MSVNASVRVINGDVNKALNTLEKRLRKEKLWKYDPAKRHYRQKKKNKKQMI
jgi:uncharacterized protein YqcC (DUF446 family)